MKNIKKILESIPAIKSKRVAGLAVGGFILAALPACGGVNHIQKNVVTPFQPTTTLPKIHETAYIHPGAHVIGDCWIGQLTMMSPTAVCRGDEGTPIAVGDQTNIQDGVILHALATHIEGERIAGRKFSATAERLATDSPEWDKGFAIWVGERVSLAHGSQVHGPAWVGNDVFVGMEVMVFDAVISDNSAIGVGSTITGGVVIPEGRYVPPGSTIDTQAKADALGPRVGSPYEKINEAVVYVNKELAQGYMKAFGR